ncbi:MAG: hypothetical protein ACE5SW_07500 [Nitrososphaeraceae archaeon]
MRDSYYADSLQKSKKKKTKCITFRLDEGVVTELTKESDQKEISLNVLVNQILKRYAEWDKYENKIGVIPVPRVMMTKLIDKSLRIAKDSGINNIEEIKKEIITEAVEIAYSSLKESVLFMRSDFNLFSVLYILEEYMKVCGLNSEHKFDNGRRHVFTLQHDMGENWSIFSKELLEKIFINLAQVKTNITYTNNTVIAEVML